MSKFRYAFVAVTTLMVLALGSGLAQALPILSPKWKPNWLRPKW